MKLHIDRVGTGPDLVLIHGWGMHGGVWKPIARKLSTQFRLHIVDLPGMGFSSPIEPAHLHALADCVSEAMPENADICGWSLGGLVAMRLALSRPQLVRRLVLVGATPCFTNKQGTPEQPDWMNGIDAKVFRQFASEVGKDYQGTLLKFLTLQSMGAGNARSIIKQLRQSFAERPVPSMESLQKALRVLLENDLRDEIVHLHQPVLLIHGDRDSLAPVQAAHWLVKHLPSAQLRVIAGASHAPFLSHEEQFSTALMQFLKPQLQT